MSDSYVLRLSRRLGIGPEPPRPLPVQQLGKVTSKWKIIRKNCGTTTRRNPDNRGLPRLSQSPRKTSPGKLWPPRIPAPSSSLVALARSGHRLRYPPWFSPTLRYCGKRSPSPTASWHWNDEGRPGVKLISPSARYGGLAACWREIPSPPPAGYSRNTSGGAAGHHLSSGDNESERS